MKRSTRFRLIRSFAVLSAALAAASCAEEPNNVVEASGVIETTDVTISALTPGNVVDLRVRDGDRVRKGDTLLIVDDTDLLLQRRGLLAGVDASDAQLTLIREGARREEVEQAAESVEQARAGLNNAEDDLKRIEQMVQAGALPEKQLVDARTRREVALRTYRGAELLLKKLREGARASEIDAGSARVTQAEAQLAVLEQKIRDTRLLAPISGTVTGRAVEEGEFVGVGTRVMTISDSNPVTLKIYVPEDQLGRVRLGQKAELTIDTFPDRIYAGSVVYISPTAEFTPRNIQTREDRVKLVFEVRIEAPNPDGELKAGLIADARLVPDSVAAE